MALRFNEILAKDFRRRKFQNREVKRSQKPVETVKSLEDLPAGENPEKSRPEM